MLSTWKILKGTKLAIQLSKSDNLKILDILKFEQPRSPDKDFELMLNFLSTNTIKITKNYGAPNVK